MEYLNGRLAFCAGLVSACGALIVLAVSPHSEFISLSNVSNAVLHEGGVKSEPMNQSTSNTSQGGGSVQEISHLAPSTAPSTLSQPPESSEGSQLRDNKPVYWPPWKPPALDAQGIERIELGLNFTVSCNAHCQAQMECKDDLVLQCFGSQPLCRCSEIRLPTEERQPSLGPSFAILMCGQTRSFYSLLMRKYWHNFLSLFKDDLALFAVLSTFSAPKSGRKEIAAKKAGKPVSTRSTFPKRRLMKILKSFPVSRWDAVLLDDWCTWNVARKQVHDATLRKMLDVTNRSAGHANAYRARVVAFDLMLRFERKNRQRFGHVIVLRPDTIVDLRPSPVVKVPLNEVVYLHHDLLAYFPRRFASVYLTFVATVRTLEGSGSAFDSEALRFFWQKLTNRSSVNKGFASVVLHLAFHGIPFCGFLFLSFPWIGCQNEDDSKWKHSKFNRWMTYSNIFFVRDYVYTGVGQQRVCLDHRHAGEEAESLRQYLNSLKIEESLFEGLSLCEE